MLTYFVTNFIVNICTQLTTSITFLFIGFYSQDDVDGLLVESLKMKRLNHSNVMTLEGVCLDAGPAPFIVLPYMAGIYIM